MLVRTTWLLITLVLVLGEPAWAQETLRYAGATTLQRFFMPDVARLFYDETGIRVSIEGGNTNPGLYALHKREIDMAGAGRHLTAEEKQQGLVEHFLGWDVLTIVVHQSNPVTDLSRAQLGEIFSGEITNWKQVGGADQPIILITSPKGSGMRTSVKKLLLLDKGYSEREIISAIVAECDHQVSLFPTAITALSRSMVDSSNIKTVKVDGVEPTAGNVTENKYPLAKPLALVTLGAPEGPLKRFIEVTLSPRGQTLLQKHFVPKLP